MGGLLRFGVCAQQRKVRVGRQGGGAALVQLLRGETGPVVARERGKQRVLRHGGLHPHLGGCFAFGAPGAASGLHEECQQAFGRAEVAGQQRRVRIDGGHERHAAEVVPLGNHLRADEHVHVAAVYGGQMRVKLPDAARAVGVDAQYARGFTVRALHFAERGGDAFFKLFRAQRAGADVGVAAFGAGARHGLRQPAVVAAQRAVAFVEGAPGAAVRAFAAPAAVVAMQGSRPATAVEQQQRLLASAHAGAYGFQQRRGDDGAARHAAHVHAAHGGQGAAAGALRQLQALVAPGTVRRRGAGVPAFQ